jgi:hypothetical protein
MKQVRTALLGLAFVFALVAFVQAQEAEKTLKGTITCAKCDLKKEDKCTTVIVVKEDGKDVIYYFDDKAGKAKHKDICKEGKKGTVTGTVEKKGDKNIVTVKEAKFD